MRLAAAPRSGLAPEQLDALDAASVEYERSRLLNADDPAAMVELGDFHAEGGRSIEA